MRVPMQDARCLSSLISTTYIYNEKNKRSKIEQEGMLFRHSQLLSAVAPPER